jgi:hypothetical protein
MATNSRNLPAPRPLEFSESTLNKILDQQVREAELRETELGLRAQELQVSSAHAEKILGVQERDRNAERDFDLKRERWRLCFAGFCVFLLVVLMLLGMYMEKDAFVNDLLKILGGLVMGAIGGYGYAKMEAGRNE